MVGRWKIGHLYVEDSWPPTYSRVEKIKNGGGKEWNEGGVSVADVSSSDFSQCYSLSFFYLFSAPDCSR